MVHETHREFVSEAQWREGRGRRRPIKKFSPVREVSPSFRDGGEEKREKGRGVEERGEKEGHSTEVCDLKSCSGAGVVAVPAQRREERGRE